MIMWLWSCTPDGLWTKKALGYHITMSQASPMGKWKKNLHAQFEYSYSNAVSTVRWGQPRSKAVSYVLFSMVGSYESTNWPSTNWIVSEDFPTEKKEREKIFKTSHVVWKDYIIINELPLRICHTNTRMGYILNKCCLISVVDCVIWPRSKDHKPIVLVIISI